MSSDEQYSNVAKCGVRDCVVVEDPMPFDSVPIFAIDAWIALAEVVGQVSKEPTKQVDKLAQVILNSIDRVSKIVIITYPHQFYLSLLI